MWLSSWVKKSVAIAEQKVTEVFSRDFTVALQTETRSQERIQDLVRGRHLGVGASNLKVQHVRYKLGVGGELWIEGGGGWILPLCRQGTISIVCEAQADEKGLAGQNLLAPELFGRDFTLVHRTEAIALSEPRELHPQVKRGAVRRRGTQQHTKISGKYAGKDYPLDKVHSWAHGAPARHQATHPSRDFVQKGWVAAVRSLWFQHRLLV